jgi:hypothetical protein
VASALEIVSIPLDLLWEVGRHLHGEVIHNTYWARGIVLLIPV